jgi:hypothetical protein
MTSPIQMTGAQPAPAQPRFDPYTGEPIQQDYERIEEQFTAPPGISEGMVESIQSQLPPEAPTNPYAPTGWKRKNRIEFDLQTPSGQMCRVMRLEREDLFRMNLMQYLDTFTPTLMDDTVMSDEEKDRKVKEALKTNPNALGNMFMAIDQVVMAATIRPKVTDDEKLTDYGKPKDWANPRFIATAYINDISMDDRMAIFGAAFGKSMDDLKSVFKQTPGLGSMADEPGVQSTAE